MVKFLLQLVAASLVVAGVAFWSAGGAFIAAGVLLVAISERFDVTLVDEDES